MLWYPLKWSLGVAGSCSVREFVCSDPPFAVVSRGSTFFSPVILMNPVILLAAALHGTAHPYSCAKGLPAAEMPFCNGKLAVADRVRISALHNTALSLESSVKYRNHDCKMMGEKGRAKKDNDTHTTSPEANVYAKRRGFPQHPDA